MIGVQIPDLHSISIHTLRVEGDTRHIKAIGTVVISIHTLRVEGDTLDAPSTSMSSRISIHTLRVEGDAACPPSFR